MIGIRFEIPNSFDIFLNKILKNVNINNYNWKVLEDEVYLDGCKDLIIKDWYDYDEFSNLISRKPYYLIFLNIQAYLSENADVIISNYEDFQKSDCQLIILVVDSTFVDIYAKDKKDIETIYKNAIGNEFENIEYIENNGNPRNVFTF